MAKAFDLLSANSAPLIAGVEFNKEAVGDRTEFIATITDPTQLPKIEIVDRELARNPEIVPHKLTKGLRFRLLENGGVKLDSEPNSADPKTLTMQFSRVVLDTIEGRRTFEVKVADPNRYPSY